VPSHPETSLCGALVGPAARTVVRVPYEVTEYRCASCDGRGSTPENVRHVVICADPSEVVAVIYTQHDTPARPLFGDGASG